MSYIRPDDILIKLEGRDAVEFEANEALFEGIGIRFLNRSDMVMQMMRMYNRCVDLGLSGKNHTDESNVTQGGEQGV